MKLGDVREVQALEEVGSIHILCKTFKASSLNSNRDLERKPFISRSMEFETRALETGGLVLGMMRAQ